MSQLYSSLTGGVVQLEPVMKLEWKITEEIYINVTSHRRMYSYIPTFYCTVYKTIRVEEQ